ncbi:MAG: ribosome recycling factor [Nitrospirae bacterium]|nr:MAG: ribosome recycling factor [Nitrospirota bacterium]
MITDVLQKVTKQMDNTLEHLKRELAGLRGGRASLSLLDRIQVNYYGTLTPLKQVANLATPESRLITIQPWDPSLIKEIEKAILASELGLTPSNDGKIIRLPVPPLSEERRRELVKVAKKYGEETKIHIRGIRREGNEELKRLQKEAKITEDDLRRGEAEIQKITDREVKKVDELLKKKEEEILEI